MKTRRVFGPRVLPIALVAAMTAGVTFSPVVVRAQAQAQEEKEAPTAQPIAKQLLGHWGLDREQMMKVLTARAAEGAGGQGFDNAARDLLVEMVNQMTDRMVLEFKADGISRVHSPDHQSDANYKIVKAEEDTGEFALEVTPDGNGAVDMVEGKIKGNHLSTKSDGMNLHFRRLSAEQAKARLDKIREAAEAEKNGPGPEPERGQGQERDQE